MKWFTKRPIPKDEFKRVLMRAKETDGSETVAIGYYMFSRLYLELTTGTQEYSEDMITGWCYLPKDEDDTL